MTKNNNNRRDQVRLPGRSSSASGFTGEHTRSLPAQARVADVSEGGLRLLVDWPEETFFPVYSGDVVRFQLKVEGADGIFEILSVVRHVDTADSRGRVGLGVQFCGLDRRVRASLTRALVNTGQDPAAQLGQRQTGLRGGRRFRRAAPVRNDPV